MHTYTPRGPLYLTRDTFDRIMAVRTDATNIQELQDPVNGRPLGFLPDRVADG